MALPLSTSKVKSFIKSIKQAIPYKVVRKDSGFTSDAITNRDYLVIVDGQDSVIKSVERDRDDGTLQYEDKEVAITSKPLMISGNRVYFSRDGFVGTMALNTDTLLSADAYQPSEDEKDVNKKEPESYKGELSLEGSKKTLKKLNEAKRLRKLLEPQGLDKQTLLMAIGSGVAVGFVLSKQMGA